MPASTNEGSVKGNFSFAAIVQGEDGDSHHSTTMEAGKARYCKAEGDEQGRGRGHSALGTDEVEAGRSETARSAHSPSRADADAAAAML